MGWGNCFRAIGGATLKRTKPHFVPGDESELRLCAKLCRPVNCPPKIVRVGQPVVAWMTNAFDELSGDGEVELLSALPWARCFELWAPAM